MTEEKYPLNKEKFERLIDRKKKGGERRRRILACIIENPGSSQIEIAKMVYGEAGALDGYKSLRIHLNKLKEAGVVELKGGRGGRHVYPISDVKRVYKKAGITTMPKDTREFMRILNKWVLTNPLTHEEKSKLSNILSDQVLQVLFAVSMDMPLFPPEDQTEKYRKLKPLVPVWECLKGLWIYEMQLSEPPRGSLAFASRKQWEKHPYFGLPAGVGLVGYAHLTQKVADLGTFINELAFKNQILAELMNHVKIAYAKRKNERGKDL
jgi:DNA-binding transcriptional ArsR family regulator